MNIQEKTQTQTTKKVFYETDIDHEEEIDKILEGAEELKFMPWSGLVQVSKFKKGDKVITYIRDQINNKVLLVEDDLEGIIDKIFEKLEEGLSKYFPGLEGCQMYDREIEYYKEIEGGEAYEQFFTDIDIPISMTNKEISVKTAKVWLLYNSDTQQYGLKVSVYYEDILPALYDYIYSNYQKAN